MRYDYNKLKDFGTKVMVAAGLGEDEAEIFMDNLLYADSRGMGSHGISRLINYSKRVQCGVITPKVDAEVIKESTSCLVIDGHNGIGAKIARQAIDMCMERARKTGCCVATVRNGNHFGAGAFYTKYAAQKGFIPLMVSNSEAAVAPIGGKIVKPGDIVVGDDDGVLFIDPAIANEVADATEAVEKKEAGIMKDILEKGTYIRPWVDELLKTIGCEII